jgi:preprotein translocase subunit SecG
VLPRQTRNNGESYTVLTFVITMVILLIISGLVLLAVARGEGGAGKGTSDSGHEAYKAPDR